MRCLPNRTERGSAMIMALFVLVLVAGTGMALLFISDNELKMSRADLVSKQLFFISEGGLEDARDTLFAINKVSSDPRDLDEELLAVSGDGTIDFDPAALVPVFNSSGVLTGFAGYGNDVPLRAMTPLAGGWYIAFMQNDPTEGATTVSDTNDRVLLTAMAVRPDRRVEMVQALVEQIDTFAIPPAAITILGPNAVFDGGASNAKSYVGNDYGTHCPPGVSGEVPVVGVIGAASEISAEMGVQRPLTYRTGSDTGLDTVDDLTLQPDLPDLWTDCELLVELATVIKGSADVVGNSATPLAALGVPGAPKVVFIEGDYTVSGAFAGAGLLFVTGLLDFDGRASWEGPIFVVGKGDFLRNGAGNGTIAGGVIVADVAGPDRILFTADDCSGDDGTFGTSDDGIAQSTYIVTGSGTGTTGYCSAYFTRWQGLRPFKILSFRQS